MCSSIVLQQENTVFLFFSTLLSLLPFLVPLLFIFSCLIFPSLLLCLLFDPSWHDFRIFFCLSTSFGLLRNLQNEMKIMFSHVELYSRIKLVVTSYLDNSGSGIHIRNIFLNLFSTCIITSYFDEFMNSQKYYERNQPINIQK